MGSAYGPDREILHAEDLSPPAAICAPVYFLAYIDRINVSFAALTMRGDLKMSAAEYGFAVGTFYWGYFIFEVPSNIVLEKVGARLWIARIMITWGILAGLTAMVTGIDQLRRRPLPAGRGRGGVLPRHRALFHLLVPDHHHARIVSGFLIGAADRGGCRGADLYRAPGPGRAVRAQGLADHVHRRGRADRADRRCDLFVLTDRPAQATIPDRRGKILADREARVGADGEGGGAQVQLRRGVL